MRITQDARWAADMYAEKVTVLEEDEEMATLELELLPPASERVGLIMLASGPATSDISPGALQAGAVSLVSELLSHHEVS